MAKRTLERGEVKTTCPNCNHSFYNSKAAEFHAIKLLEVTGENATNRLEDERKASKQKTKELEEKIEQLLGELATAEAELKKERRELGVERKHLADRMQKYEELKKGEGYCGHPCTIPSCVQEKAKNLLKEPCSGRKVATEKANSNLLEESCRPCAGIREDFQYVYKVVSSFKEGQDKFERLLTEQQQRCNDEKKEMREQFQRKLDDRKEQIKTLKLEKIRLKEEKEAILEKHGLQQTRCKEEAQGHETLRAELKCAKSKEREMVNEIYHLKKELERQQYEHAAECHLPKCASMAQKVEELEIVVEKQSAQLNKRFTLQPDIHEGLILEYQKLLANYEILKLVEGCFTESFDAKGFLSDIFMDAYVECKDCLMRVVCKNIGELFKLQTDESRIEELEGLSHAFGLLLQTSGIRMMVTASEAVALIRQKVEDDIPQLKRFNKATPNVAGLAKQLPLEKFVQLAWKFVTQAYPTIVHEPIRLKFDDEIHKTSFKHWDEKKDGERPVIYAQPVVYRSYHGEVMIKGLVGN